MSVLCWTGASAHVSVVSAVIGALLLAGALLRMLAEERQIMDRHPEYRQYARTTKWMVPYVF